jgi:hypothetical protein
MPGKLQDFVTEARKIHSQERGVLSDSLRVIPAGFDEQKSY